MGKKFNEYRGLDLSGIGKEVLDIWEVEDAFSKSLDARRDNPDFVFYEGPPSANGMPGIHHVMSRSIKDVVCRYKTLKGYRVERKAGWDTHGLPVELGVEKKMGITKEDIGKTVSVSDYNRACREEVMMFTGEWEELTKKIGYWVDMQNPYITYDNRYIETLWYLLKQLYDKGYLYKGYTIQPYSPAAGTGLSTHELNQPGCYKDVKDTTCVAEFRIVKDAKYRSLFPDTPEDEDVCMIAWTTTPWTLPSNTALAVGKDIDYTAVRTFNPYTCLPVTLILAKERLGAYFNNKAEGLSLSDYKKGDKLIPYEVTASFKGGDLAGLAYEQLMPWVKPDGKAFAVIEGDYVSTEDGTGIVHIAPTFGADDDRVAKAAGIVPLLLVDKDGNKQPMVDRRGRFFPMEDLDPDFIATSVNRELYGLYAGRFVKNAYDPELEGREDVSLDIDLAVALKSENKAFKIEKHVHNYPHCWRTDKPVLYYPLDSWFVRTTAAKERMLGLNRTICWKPAATGEGRFGKWLENLVDWNLSRSRFWGTPLPIWVNEEGTEKKCIGSAEELIREIERSVTAGLMDESPYPDFVPGDFSKENYDKLDLHRPYVDEIVLADSKGKPMFREKDLIDVWFDSGAMPYAQLHYPFENRESIDGKLRFPADFIAEGVDQTRGWFFTLHAIATMVFDSVAFKNIISNGLVLDAGGNKMSKRLGNAVDPFDVIEKHGPDALRWYMITSSQPWDNLKFDISGVEEVKRKFFGTLYNTYGFFALYANVDGFTYAEEDLPLHKRPEIDRWILSLLNTLKKEVGEAYENYELTRAGRLIQDFVIEHLSNWYVRLSRKRYWGGGFTEDKLSAYQTLYRCLEGVALLASPIAPFYTDKLFRDLNAVTGRVEGSVHTAAFPNPDATEIDNELEMRMQMAQQISSMVLALRRKVKIRVRQPLAKIMIPIDEPRVLERLKAVESIILSEVNVKHIEYITDTTGVLIKKIKPNFKVLGPKFGKYMKEISAAIAALDQKAITDFEKKGNMYLKAGGENLFIELSDVEILSEDIPGWLVANEGRFTVALDINITKELREEGLARELINRIQNLRKESAFDVTDKITVDIYSAFGLDEAVRNFSDHIANQVLATSIRIVDTYEESLYTEIEIDEIKTYLKVTKI